MHLPDRLIPPKELCKELDISPPTRWRWTRDGILPPPIRIKGTKKIGYSRAQIDAWKIDQGWPTTDQVEG